MYFLVESKVCTGAVPYDVSNISPVWMIAIGAYESGDSSNKLDVTYVAPAGAAEHNIGITDKGLFIFETKNAQTQLVVDVIYNGVHTPLNIDLQEMTTLNVGDSL